MRRVFALRRVPWARGPGDCAVPVFDNERVQTRAYAYDSTACPRRARAPEDQDQEPRAQGVSAAPWRLHACLHHHAQEAELRAA